ncbi:fatty-acid amide hydrolase 2-A-like [Ornithodoros turicata]|uniref:fatty-acid amide hydrolase 2-A-like n=1 Tax=Ornithodoros turicata TaxID=34597 RepID=UPI0031397791
MLGRTLEFFFKVCLFVQELFLYCYDNVVHFVFGLWYSRVPQQALPPISDPLLLQPATTLAEKIRTKEVKCADVVRAYIKRIKEVQPMLNAIVDECFEAALEEAEEIDRILTSDGGAAMTRNQPLLGVPFTVKNYIGLEDHLQDTGSWYFKGHRADDDAKSVEFLRVAGAIPLAVSNVPEMCFSSDCSNRVYGRTNNPYDTNRIPGGSSGGESALLASAASLVGVGTDIFGSLRCPAACCGIFTHKPTSGSVSLNGLYPDLDGDVSKFNNVGPMVRYVEDLLPVLKVLVGPQESKRLNLDTAVDIKSVKLHYVPYDGAEFISRVQPVMTAAVYMAVTYLETICEMKSQHFSFPELRDATDIWMANFTAASKFPLAQLLQAKRGRLRPLKELLLTAIGKSHHSLASIFFVQYQNRGKFQDEGILREYAVRMKAFSDILESTLGEDGVLILPANSAPAPYHNEWLSRFTYFISFTCLFNLVGVPVTVVPVTRGNDGMPAAVQVVAGRNQDRLCLAVAKELAKGFGGWKPPVAASD